MSDLVCCNALAFFVDLVLFFFDASDLLLDQPSGVEEMEGANCGWRPRVTGKLKVVLVLSYVASRSA